VDHVLPSKVGLNPIAGGVFWPLNSDPTFSLVSASDHRLVWTDYAVVPVLRQAVKGLLSSIQGNDLVLTWTAQVGVTYKIERSTDFATWSDTPAIPINVDAGTQLATATDAGGLVGQQKYYRVVTSLDASSPAPAVSTSAPVTVTRKKKRR
jgi:hypothetical protein